jgi:hypothetical protein
VRPRVVERACNERRPETLPLRRLVHFGVQQRANAGTPIRLAMRATALLTADAMPASAWSASASTVAVSGATVIVNPSEKTRIPGSSSVR